MNSPESNNPRVSEAFSNSFYPGYCSIGGPPSISNGEFYINGLEEQVSKARNEFFFHPNIIGRLGLDQYLLSSSNFREREDWRLGREDSGQGVFFGELRLGIDNGDETTLPIACKPYKLLERHRAIHEYAALEKFKDSPTLKSYEPIGFWVDGQGGATLLTSFEEQVTSLDNVNWDKSGKDILHDHYDLFSALKRSAQILARLHAVGYAHHDAQIKNMAIDKYTQAVRLIDLTSLRKIHKQNDLSLETWRGAVYGDLYGLISSVRRKGYLHNEAPNNIRKTLNLAFFSVHAAIISHPSSQRTLFPEALQVVEHIHEDILDQTM